jgi:hypothetical protein
MRTFTSELLLPTDLSHANQLKYLYDSAMLYDKWNNLVTDFSFLCILHCLSRKFFFVLESIRK